MMGGRAGPGEVSGTPQLTWSPTGLSPTLVPVGTHSLGGLSSASPTGGSQCFPSNSTRTGLFRNDLRHQTQRLLPPGTPGPKRSLIPASQSYRIMESLRLEKPFKITTYNYYPSTAKGTINPCPQVPHPFSIPPAMGTPPLPWGSATQYSRLHPKHHAENPEDTP